MGKFYLICGDDDFRIKERSRELVNQLCGGSYENAPDLEIIGGAGSELAPTDWLNQAADALATPPFLTPTKKIWLCHCSWLDQLNNKELASGFERLAVELERGLPEGVDLVWDGVGLDQRTAAFNRLKAIKNLELENIRKISSFDRDYSRNRQDFIVNFVSSFNKRIGSDGVLYFIDVIGSDSGRLQRELEKLISYVGDQNNITLQDCRNSCSRTPEAMIWDFANALMERNKAEALRVLDVSLGLMSNTGGSPEIGIMRQVERSYLELLNSKADMEELQIDQRVSKSFFDSSADLKERYPENGLLKLHPFRAFKICQRAGGYTTAELVRALNAISEAGRQLVSGGEGRLVLEQLINTI